MAEFSSACSFCGAGHTEWESCCHAFSAPPQRRVFALQTSRSCPSEYLHLSDLNISVTGLCGIRFRDTLLKSLDLLPLSLSQHLNRPPTLAFMLVFVLLLAPIYYFRDGAPRLPDPHSFTLSLPEFICPVWPVRSPARCRSASRAFLLQYLNWVSLILSGWFFRHSLWYSRRAWISSAFRFGILSPPAPLLYNILCIYTIRNAYYTLFIYHSLYHSFYCFRFLSLFIAKYQKSLRTLYFNVSSDMKR